MIEAAEFVECARHHGFQWYTGVPCSFLTPFINYVINDDALNYISSANEGDAVATAAGLHLGGKRAVAMMQNSGLGNAVSPITSLSYVFRIPTLLICTHRGAPGIQDEPQHALMGQITPALFDTMKIPWEAFPTKSRDIPAVLERAVGYMEKEQRPYALIMQKGTVAKHALNNNTPARTGERTPQRHQFYTGHGQRPARHEALRHLIEHTNDDRTIIIGTTGYTGRELFALGNHHNHFYMVGSMGCASSLGLGLALARTDVRVIVVDGDGAALMRMGNFSTLGVYGQDNLIHIVLDNEVHDSTGAQATVSTGVRFAGIAAACGYGTVMEGDDLKLLDALLNTADSPGARFGHIKIQAGTLDPLPRPDCSPTQVKERLMRHLYTMTQS